MSRSANFSAIGTSTAVHFLLLGALGLIHQELQNAQPEVVLETVFDDEREQEEFTRDLETDPEIAETQNFMAGGAVSTAVGGSAAPAVAQQKIEQSETLQEIDFAVNATNIDLPGEEMIGQELGVGEVNGEVGAVVEGYGAALSRLSQELIRLMRQRKVMVVWLFDESESMQDDQQEIAQKFHKVYEELEIQSRSDKTLKLQDEVLMTTILSFGAGIHELTKTPTTKVKDVKAAIDAISIDESGDENMCSAIQIAVAKYGKMARSQKRQLIVVVVSDESPTDDAQIEDTVQICEKAKSPVYILGREATFGYPYARIKWVDSVYQLTHWASINRGPETAFPECLQWNGLHARHDSQSSGFGPYSQVRLCKETGGIFFMLPGEEDNIVGRPKLIAERKYAALAMKEYEPLLLARKDYAAARAKSRFRTVMWDVIVGLNPHLDKRLSMQTWHFSIDPVEFKKQGFKQFEKATYAMKQLEKAIGMMDGVRELRAKEESQRWRACFDLTYAQCIAYRVRLFQYMLTLDEHAAANRLPKNPKHNRWDIHWRNTKPKEPTDDQFTRIKKAFAFKGDKVAYMKMLEDERQKANDGFDSVSREHEGTPWDARARYGKSRGFEFTFASHFHDPKYAQVGKKIPQKKF
jgi:hypothetical protein